MYSKGNLCCLIALKQFGGTITRPLYVTVKIAVVVIAVVKKGIWFPFQLLCVNCMYFTEQSGANLISQIIDAYTKRDVLACTHKNYKIALMSSATSDYTENKIMQRIQSIKTLKVDMPILTCIFFIFN